MNPSLCFLHQWTWTGVLLTSERDPQGPHGWNQPGYGYPGNQGQQQQYDEHGNPIEQEEPDESLLGRIKGFFKGKKDKPSGDQITGQLDLEWNPVKY